MLRVSAIIFLLVSFFSCKNETKPQKRNIEIAFIADAHFQDIYAHFDDANYNGVKNPNTETYVNIRTMDSQLKSTRLFNENYFAFIQALDDIVSRGIKYVALPGDFSDDGQPVHVKGLRKILDDYANKHGILFFATTGNHDPVRPFAQDASKSDFLGKNGKEQIITSSVKNLKKINDGQLQPIITSEIKKWGYKDILNEMSAFGFYPQKEYLYWETPFTSYSYDNYSFESAKKGSDLNRRVYAIDKNNWHPDASYLVEPTDGLWLLAIDANVYMPNKELEGESNNPKDFSGSSIGYNHVLLKKTHLINWVKKVSNAAKQKGKILIAFSHYPMVDFNDDASNEMKTFFGKDNMQLYRVPNEEVAEVFADAGIQIHLGGHMHINDTGVRTSKKGNTLFNIQTPSLAAYTPAYKILTVHSKTGFEIETIVIKDVKNFNSLFPLYEQEYIHLKNTKNNHIWNKDILKTKNYKDFTQFHLKELVRLRFLNNDWPIEFRDLLLKSTGKELLFLNSKINKKELIENLLNENITVEELEKWTGIDMIFDFYRLRSADELAINDIGVNRLKQYKIVCDVFIESDLQDFKLWGMIFKKASYGAPSNHFEIDLKSGVINRLTP